MTPYRYRDFGLRILGALHNQARLTAILDAAERQFAEVGPSSMSMKAIAEAAGMPRGAVRRYHRSEHTIILALVQRATQELTDAAHGTGAEIHAGAVRDEVTVIIGLIEAVWGRHGAVMKAAIELTPSDSGIAKVWASGKEEQARAVERITESVHCPLEQMPSVDPHGLSRSLLALTEHVFYQTYANRLSLAQASAVLVDTWMRTLLVDDADNPTSENQEVTEESP